MHKQNKISELSDREVLEKMRRLYVSRKSANRGFALQTLTNEVGNGGISRPTFFQAIFNKVASHDTIKLFRLYFTKN
jgi:hypothetical protein